MPSRSNNITMPVGHADYTKILSTGHARHVSEGEGFPNLLEELYGGGWGGEWPNVVQV